MAKMRAKNLAFTDKRVKFLNQVLKNMRVVKMFALEKLVQRVVKRIRRKEWIFGMSYTLLRTVASPVIFTFGNYFAIYITFLVSYFTDSPIGFGKAVLCFMLYMQIQNYASNFIQCVAACVEIFVSGNRISKYLHIKASKKINPQNITSMDGAKCIHIQNLNVEWPNHSKGLENINLTVSNEPQLIFVTGAVGAGKSTLLLTLCNEIFEYQGSVQVRGRIAYAAQESWVFSGTIRDNIIVGSEFEYDHYWKVIAACGLMPDLETLTDRDLTLVGERGITLSGGQKARVALARTVYTVADIYLLDDPLGAVDTHVSKLIFEECIQGLLRGKVVILATHQTRFARDHDRMVILENGRILEDNKYKKAKWEGFSELIGMDESNQCKEKEVDTNVGIVDLDCVRKREGEMTELKPLSTALSEEISDHAKFWIYPKYFKTGGLCFTFLLILFTVVSNLAQLSFVWWVQKFMWLASIAHSYDNVNFTTNYANQTWTIAPPWFLHIISFKHYIAITALLVGIVVFLTNEWLLITIIAWRATVKLHSKMMKSVLSTSIRFFEINPSGRVLNRFSKDVGYADFNITVMFIEYWILLFGIIFPVIAACFVQKILILPGIVLIIVFFGYVSLLFTDSNSIAKSRISHEKSTLFTYFTHLARNDNHPIPWNAAEN